MSKVAVVYWTQTGNTEAMANAIAEAAGADAIDVADFDAGQVADFDAFAFGCPAMGSEELDPDLFGSYDWGNGEWMDTWKSEAEDAGVNIIDTVIANLDPDDEAIEQLKALGAKLAG